MKGLLRLGVMVVICLGVNVFVVVLNAQQSVETIPLAQHPLQRDSQSGTLTARIGEGRLFQMDATLIEIPPGGQLPAHRHLAEELIYIVSGAGHTQMWNRETGRKEKYEWKEGDFLSPTLNAWHQHGNSSSSAPARYLSITSTPLIRNLFHNEEIVTSVDFPFDARWESSVGREPVYVEGPKETSEAVQMKVGHFLPNLPGRKMEERRPGVLGITIRPEGDMAENHIMEMEVREYLSEQENSPGHRHFWETIYYILDGEGFAVLQRKGEKQRRVPWKKGDLFVVEANEYHLHRAKAGGTARMLQIKAAGYFHNVVLEEFVMQPGPFDAPK